MTPQLTEQYGHVLRVSLVREIFSVRDCATTGATSSPNADSAAPPAIDRWMKARLEIAISTSVPREKFATRWRKGCPVLIDPLATKVGALDDAAEAVAEVR